MPDYRILHPVFVLALWTMLVLSRIAYVRIKAGFKGEITPADFRSGESSRVPEHVSIPNRNYMNLLELPVLFYVACLILYVTHTHSPALLMLAWFYVALRIVHSLIHLGYNNVMHRLAAFALSNLILLVIWIMTGISILANPGH